VPGSGWLLVSKPLRPPLNDGSSVLVHDLVAHLPPDRGLSYFGDQSAPVRAGARDDVIEAAPMGHSPSAAAKARVLGSIARPGRRAQPLHFFFTPNKVTSLVVAGLRKAQPRRLMIQTIMSSDGAGSLARFLRPLDAVVALSDATKRTLRRAGVRTEKLHRIHPGVRVGAPPGPDVPARKRLLFAGDLDADVVRRLGAVAEALERAQLSDWSLTIAARPKGDDDARQRELLAQRAAALIEAGRVELLGEVADMDALMQRCTVQLFLADHVRRKVDLPLALLEGLARGLGLIALDFQPLNEIFERGADHGLEPGVALPVDVADADLVEAVARAVSDDQALLTWSREAHQLAAREFSIEAMARQYAELYERLEDQHGRHG
jgi:phosphatidylinositol alpha-1,6-mannosyltransferase